MSSRALKASIAQCRDVVLVKSLTGVLAKRFSGSRSELRGSKVGDLPISTPSTSVLETHGLPVGKATKPRFKKHKADVSPRTRSLFKAFMRMRLFNLKTGNEFLNPQRLTCPIDVPYLDAKTVYRTRTPVLRTHLERVFERWAAKFIHQSWTSDEKFNPLYATQGSPGMGKSTMIDTLSALSFEQVRELSPNAAPDEFCHWVVDSVHVNIDFNGPQTLKRHELDDDERIIATRLIHNYFAGQLMWFEQVCDALRSAPQFDQLTILDAVDMIRLHRAEVVGKPAPSVFIYIDEFRRLAKHWESAHFQESKSISPLEIQKRMGREYSAAREFGLLTKLGSVLSDAALNSVFISTLDNCALRFDSSCISDASTGRKVLYLKLDLLNGHELFKDQEVYKFQPAVRRMVAEIGGHPRTLVGLGEVLESDQFKEKYSNGEPVPFDDLLKDLREKVLLIGSSPQSDSVMDAVVARCLLGKSVGLDEPILEKGSTFSSYISEGYLLNSACDENDRIIPTMAPYVLRQYLIRKADLFGFRSEIDRMLCAMFRMPYHTYAIKRGSTKVVYERIAEVSLDIDAINAPKPVAWKSIENFHAQFEVLRSLLLVGQQVPLGQLYPASMVHPNQVDLLNMCIDVTARSLKELYSHLKCVSASACAANSALVVVPTAHNPGFDMLIPLGKSGRVGLFIGNGFSDAESQTTLSVSDIQQKRDLTDRACQGKLPVKDQLKTRVLVLVSMQHVSINPQILPSGTLVLNQAASLQMYGPTLSPLATWFDIECRIAMDAAEKSDKNYVAASSSSTDVSKRLL